MLPQIKKVIIPVAGFGTRFLPFTKTIPKELLPIINVPLINLLVQNALDSGIKEIILISSKYKIEINKNFLRNKRLEKHLLKNNRKDLIKSLNKYESVKIKYIYQQKQNGLGDAILCAKNYIKNEPFAILLGDEYVKSNIPSLKQCIDVYNKTGVSVVGVRDVIKKDVHKYGIVKPLNESKTNVFKIIDVVEKPKNNEAPSTKAIFGPYIFKPEIFNYLETIKKGVGGEIQLTDAIKKMLRNHKINAFCFKGKRFDIGSKLGFVLANIDAALNDEEIKNDVIYYIKNNL